MNTTNGIALHILIVDSRDSLHHFLRAGLLGGSATMAERSFAKEVLKLRAGAGEVVEAEGIVAITKALLEACVSWEHRRVAPGP